MIDILVTIGIIGISMSLSYFVGYFHGMKEKDETR